MHYIHEPIRFDTVFDGAADAAADSRGNIYILNGAPGPISVHSPDGHFLYALGEGIIAEGHGIFIDDNDCLYIADSRLHAVFKLSHEGELLLTLGHPGHPSDTGVLNGNFKTVLRGAEPFNVPDKVCVAPDGEIFVTDGYGNARVHRFAPDGTLLASWGEPGDGPGEFHIPHGVGVCGDTVYVADRENSRIQVFDRSGTLTDIWEDIARPDGLCVWNGHVYVPELGYRMFIDNVLFIPSPALPGARVRIFNLEGKEVARIGTEDGGADGSFFSPHSINMDREGCFYVADTGWVESEIPRPAYVHPPVQKFRPVPPQEEVSP